MSETSPTPAQVKALVSASENLAAYFAIDACRVIDEWPGDENLVPYLENLPVKVVREFDEAIAAIQLCEMDSFDEEDEQRRKYEEAMAECRLTPITDEKRV